MNKSPLVLKILFILFVQFIGTAQTLNVSILGGATVSHGESISINSGSGLTFQITNTELNNCSSVKVQNVVLSNLSNFSISPTNLEENIKPLDCKGVKFLNFTVLANNIINCSSYTTRVTIESSESDFWFDLTVNTTPNISVLGGSPTSDIIDGTVTTTAINGTYFGTVESVFTETRRFYIVNTGNCILSISSITSSLPDFTIASILPYDISPGNVFYFDVTFTSSLIGGTKTATISIANNDTVSPAFNFNVSGEVFLNNILGPGGIIANFRTWLKATRGVKNTGSSVYEWVDLGTNGKTAVQPISANQPTYMDDAVSNINFNPVIKFENNGSTIEQFLYNDTNGFYSQDIFIVMVPDQTMSSSSSKNIIFGGISNGASGDNTGIGFGDSTSRFSNEVLTYAHGDETSYGNAEISTSKNYSNAGIINARNYDVSGTSMELLYNSSLLSTTSFNPGSFSNAGSLNGSTVVGTKYWIGKNFYGKASLNGRVAEIITYSERVSDIDRPKIESYLAIKYGITLGSTNEAAKNYINSAGIPVWNIAENTGFNYNVAGIARDDNSDLNQKQSKSINETNEVSIGLGLLFATNKSNINEFENDQEFLVWGCNNGTYSSSSSNMVSISASTTTSFTQIDRKWKVVETGGDVGNVFVGIPANAFSTFPKNTNEEYVLIVSDTENFTSSDIIDVVPLKSDGGSNLQTWYDFDGVKFFTFGKAPKLEGGRLVNIEAGDYLVGEYKLNLNINSFAVSAWVRSVTSSANPRTILAKGSKLQLRLNSANKIELMLDDDITPRFTSNMVLNMGKWHHISFVYDKGSVFLYIDGVLDKTIQNIVAPSPNYNRFSIGANFINKNNIINPFLGEIDEVYVWDQALSENQVRYLMNQEAEKISGDLVNGKTLPQAIAKNEVNSIPWNNLKGYYDFNSFYGTTVEGLTNSRNFLRINYLKKDSQIVDSQTAPIPYVSIADGVWGNESTWVNGASQNLPNTLGLDGSTNVDWNIVETAHNITSGDRDITVQGLKNTSGKITIANPNEVLDETNSGHGLRVTHYLEIDGEIDLVGESQLVQDDNSTLDEDSGGFILKSQQGTSNSYNYNYWSSSIGPISGSVNSRGVGVASANLGYTVNGILNDGTISSSPNNINFGSSHTWADGGISNPIKISSYWLYKFNGPDDNYNSWSKINETSVLLPGEGYTMKGSTGLSSIATKQNYVFKGKPYNGDFTLSIVSGGSRLIGNPYPSAIDANEFILDNIKELVGLNEGRNSVNVFNGALYFWHHFGEENSHNLADYVGGYAAYTLMGGVEAYSTDELINNSTPLVGGGKIPERYIPVNQGFFVYAFLDADLSNAISTTVDGGDIVFKNSQRVFERERVTGVNDGSLFFKSNKKNKNKESHRIIDSREKIRLHFSSPKGYHRQLLVGVDQSTSNYFDIGYDAPIADVGKEDMFWVIEGGKFVIQAVNNFNNEQELPLGLKVEIDGLISIKIETLENFDENVEVYIKDAFTNETHQINNDPFEINLIAGEYLQRFSLLFKSKPEKIEILDDIVIIEETVFQKDIQVIMNNSTSELNFKINNASEINHIQLINSIGQIMMKWEGNFMEREFSLPVKLSQGIYFVQINTKTVPFTTKVLVK